MAEILKYKYKYKKEIDNFEINGDVYGFRSRFGEKEIDRLSGLCDDCLIMENEMILSYNREDKDRFANILKEVLNGDIYDSLINIYKNKNSVRS